MKQTRKLLAMLLCIAMVLGMATTVFATETTTKQYTYEIFQIFTGDFEAEVLTDVEWGVNGRDYDATKTENPVDTNTLTTLEGVDSDATHEAKLAIIQGYANLSSTPFQTVTTEKANLDIDLPDGYYLVRDQAGSESGVDEFYTTYVVKVVNNHLTIERKGDVPAVEKWIVEDETDKKFNEASIGDTINYKFVGTMPTNIADYDTYFYKFSDTMSEGLTYTNNVHVYVVQGENSVEVTENFYINAQGPNENDGTTKLIVACSDVKALQWVAGVEEIDANTQIVVTYTAKLNDKALVGEDGNENVVKLVYSNDPNHDGTPGTTPPTPPTPPEGEEPGSDNPTGETPESKVETYTTEIIIEKHNEKGEILTGAEFTITGNGVNYVVTTGDVFVAYGENENIDTANCYWLLEDGTYTDEAPEGAEDATKYHKETEVTIQGVDAGDDGKTVKAFVNADGQVIFTGLGEGTYTITESVVPEGYNSIDSFEVTITWGAPVTPSEKCTWTYTGTDQVEVEGNKVHTNKVTVVNQKGSTLPETGGIGTTLFYVFGGIMVLGAAVLLVTKKRMTA